MPDLVPELARDATWEVWNDHLAAFARRREERHTGPKRLTRRLASGRRQHEAFRAFVVPAGTTVLDVGCGPGRFRERFDAGTRYVGVDPIPLLPDVLAFEFARAVSEYLPFDDGSFTDVVVLHALDHMNDVDASLREMRRLLVPGGRLHILQTVIDPGDSLRRLAHRVKDLLEDRADEHRADDTPHHMTAFSSTSLRDTVSSVIPVIDERFWSSSWLAPRRMMLTAEVPGG